MNTFIYAIGLATSFMAGSVFYLVNAFAGIGLLIVGIWITTTSSK